MNALNGTLKSLACALAAMVITSTMSYGVVASSDQYPSVAAASVTVAKRLAQPSHPWFGQPGPAVLVD